MVFGSGGMSAAYFLAMLRGRNKTADER